MTASSFSAATGVDTVDASAATAGVDINLDDPGSVGVDR